MHSGHPPQAPIIRTDIAVLREMVRLAENRRNEELAHVERVHRYNLALMAFSGSFLSLLITVKISAIIVQISGGFLVLSIACSLIALLPRVLKGGTLIIHDDVETIKQQKNLLLRPYLLTTAELTEIAANRISESSKTKKVLTLIATIFLAFALFAAYYIYVYA